MLKPMMYVFAGNNGSGKSTFRSLIVDKIGVDINIDPDAISRRLNPENPELNRVSAGKEVIRLVNEYIDAGKSFSIETTLAGKNAIRQMKTAKAKGYEITMFYVGLRNVDQNIKRVEMRVENGGHHIETEDILRRNITSFNHLYENTHLVDNLILIDNSESDGEVILEITNGAISFREENLPSWALSVVKQF